VQIRKPFVCVVDDGGADEFRAHSFHADRVHDISERLETKAGDVLEPPVLRNLFAGNCRAPLSTRGGSGAGGRRSKHARRTRRTRTRRGGVGPADASRISASFPCHGFNASLHNLELLRPGKQLHASLQHCDGFLP